jgi:hypothetical protein
MRARIKIYAVIFLSVLLATCTNYDHKILFSNVPIKQTIVLSNNSGKGNVYSIAIRTHGYINGRAQISLILNTSKYKTEQIGGNVNFNWGGDWYSDTAEILYEPHNVKSGELIIEYKFYTLN